MDEDRFVYVESDPPLSGKARQNHYMSQYMKWYAATNPDYRARMKIWRAERKASGETQRYQREYYQKRKAEKRARMLAVAREYGATLAVVLGLMVGGAAHAEELSAHTVIHRCFEPPITLDDIKAKINSTAGIAVVSSEDGKTWFVLLADLNGDLCILDSGADQ